MCEITPINTNKHEDKLDSIKSFLEVFSDKLTDMQKNAIEKR